ncbi:hypothetical protein [Asaia prunellae]|uniref:hypothetical protein n=1 Tax=Asaia prunellae TaxID=610245 RepID=UPI000470A758|nr:hypothetical protein [Asaia prunellae]
MEDKTSIKNDISLLDQSGQVFECSRKNGNIHIFHVQTDSHDMAIQSNVFVPCDDIGPFIDDRRNLGALIGKITVFSGQDSHTYDKHLQEDAVVGWHSKENTHSRWTSGSGKLEGIISKKDNFNIIAIEVL